jgi:RNA polymerase sigma factor (sigma-70 family)
MAKGASVPLLHDFRILFDSGTASGVSDRQLLERFADGGETLSEAAFEVLVLRHGPMVMRVCRNTLNDPNDVQDAFQATFLVLVRRRNAVRRFESIGGWLYGVACRVAARARVDAARRRAAERRWVGLRIVDGADGPADPEVAHAENGPIVQQEVRRLPRKYRAAVVLCYWEGLTQEQAAGKLGCPLGTVRSRLARARALLRRRLTRRGLAPLAAVVAAGLGSASASASATASASIPRPCVVPQHLIDSTVRAAARLSGGQAPLQAASAAVASLVDRFLWSTSMIKISGALLGLVFLGLAGAGAGLVAQFAGQARSVRGDSQAKPVPAALSGELSQQQTQPGKKTARGEPERESSRFAGVYSRVAGRAKIVFIVPNGSRVKKGDRICELDSATLRDQLINQRITIESAKANHGNARIASEDAELALKTYRDDLFPREQREVESDAKIAEAELALAEEERKAIEEVVHTRAALMRANLAVTRARLALEKSKNRLHVLIDYTKFRQIRALSTTAETSRSNELAKGTTVELEISKAKKLEEQIAACTIVAPTDGIVVYADVSGADGAAGGGSEVGLINEGAIVRERQPIARIVPTSGSDGGSR